MASAALETLLQTLASAGVELIVVGGLAAVAQGAPIVTRDVDIVHRRTADNITRLVEVLLSIDARYRGRPPNEVLRPTAELLSGPGHSLLQTRLGPLDVLGAIEGGRDYDALLPDTIEVVLDAARVRVLDLAAIVAIKRTSTRPKDLQMLPVLEATLRRS
jgi:hypothetical protein